MNVPDAGNVVEAFDLKSAAMEKQASPEHYVLLPDVPSTIGAKTGFFCEQRDRMDVGVPAKGHDPAQVWAYEAED